MYKYGVVIPMYNESKRHDFSGRLNKLDKGIAYAFNGLPVNVTLVFDGDDKDAYSIVKYFIMTNSLLNRWSVVYRHANKGKGYSIMEGAIETPCDYLVYTDADLPVDFNVLKYWVEDLESGSEIKAYFAVRSKFEYGRSLIRRLGGSLAQWSERIHFGIRCEDTQCALKMIDYNLFMRAVKNIFCTRWLFDVELIKLLESYTKDTVTSSVPYFNDESSSSLHPIVQLPSILAEWGYLLLRYRILYPYGDILYRKGKNLFEGRNFKHEC